MERSIELYVANDHDQRDMTEPDLRIVDDALLVDHARTDPDAFEHIYLRHSGAIYRMCLRASGDPDLADDLTATIFLKAYERLDRYQPRAGSTFRSWLFVLARNTVQDHWRRNNRLTYWSDNEPVLIDHAPGPEEIALARIELADVRAVLATLTERHRSIVEFRLSGLTTREIADALGLSISAVKSAQTRAYANIRTHLAAKGFQE